jgi:hypothetical protein
MSKHDPTVVLTSLVETVEERSTGFTVTSFNMSGEPHAAAIVHAVVDSYPTPPDVAEQLAALDGRKVTFLRTGTGMVGHVMITVIEGTLFKGGRAYLPKGKRKNGLRIDPDTILDVVEGYSRSEELRERVLAVRAPVPQHGRVDAGTPRCAARLGRQRDGRDTGRDPRGVRHASDAGRSGAGVAVARSTRTTGSPTSWRACCSSRRSTATASTARCTGRT